MQSTLFAPTDIPSGVESERFVSWPEYAHWLSDRVEALYDCHFSLTAPRAPTEESCT